MAVEFWMPLNRKIVCPDWVDGAGGTVQVVANADTGVPVLLLHDAYVIQPPPKAGFRPAARRGWTTFRGINGRPGGRCGRVPSSARTSPDGLITLRRRSATSSAYPTSILYTLDFGRRPPGVNTYSSATAEPPSRSRGCSSSATTYVPSGMRRTTCPEPTACTESLGRGPPGATTGSSSRVIGHTPASPTGNAAEAKYAFGPQRPTPRRGNPTAGWDGAAAGTGAGRTGEVSGLDSE